MNKFFSVFIMSVVLLCGCAPAVATPEGEPSPTAAASASPTAASASPTAASASPTAAPASPTAAPASPTAAPVATQTPLPSATPGIPEALLAAPAIAPPLKLGEEKNIAYTKPLQAEVNEQMLDVYYPSKEGPWPVVLILTRMSPNRGALAYVKLAQTIAGQGAVVFLPDYGTMDIYFPMVAAQNNGRLFRQTHEEIACALQTVRAKAAQFGGDPENTILLGHDTGGLYALDATLLGENLTKRWDEFAAKRGGPQAQVECLDSGEPAQVKAVVTYAGQFFYLSNVREKDAEVAALIDPLELAGGDTRPNIILMAIMSDTDIPVEPSLKVRDGLTDAGYAVEFYPLYISSTNINASGDEIGWIMNAVLQVAK